MAVLPERRWHRMEKKRILYIVEAMGGGVFTYIVELANELSKAYEVYIAYAVRKQTPNDYDTYFNENVHLIKVENFKREINPTKDIKAFREIRKIARDVQPDIIHLHSSKAGALGRWAFDGKKIPLFYTPHGYSFLMLNHNAVKRTLYRIVETVCAKRRCTTISCSEGEHQETLKLTKRACFVNNGINAAELEQMIHRLEVKRDSALTVFTLGRICYQKNPALFNKIAKQMPDVKFIWIGDGELRGELTAPNIEITGWIRREDALKYSMKADVFVLTSLWEGLPMSLLEAMCMKKLCVVSDVIGNRDAIQNGRNGYVCTTTDEFVEAIRKVENRNEVERCTDCAYTDIKERLNIWMMAKQYDAIYEKTLMREMEVECSREEIESKEPCFGKQES